MKVHVVKVPFSKAKKKKKSAHKALRLTAEQCEPGTLESAGCQGHLHFLKAESSMLSILQTEFCSGWRHEWEYSCVPQIRALCPMRPFSGWEHTHLQRFDKTLYSLPSVPWLSHDKAWGTRSSIDVITSGINGQELHALKISFRKLPDGSVGGRQHQVSVQNEPFCPPGGQVWAASGGGFWGWRGWHGWPLRGLHVQGFSDSYPKTSS